MPLKKKFSTEVPLIFCRIRFYSISERPQIPSLKAWNGKSIKFNRSKNEIDKILEELLYTCSSATKTQNGVFVDFEK